MDTLNPSQAKRILPAAIDRELKRLGWTQAELARRADITPMTISNICNGIHEPKASLLKTVADTLGVSVDSLLTATSNESGKRRKKAAIVA